MFQCCIQERLQLVGKRGRNLGFDNMQDRPFEGTASWQDAQVVLDVPRSATNIAYGFLMIGTGKMWVGDLVLEQVKEDVPSTDMYADM